MVVMVWGRGHERHHHLGRKHFHGHSARASTVEATASSPAAAVHPASAATAVVVVAASTSATLFASENNGKEEHNEKMQPGLKSQKKICQRKNTFDGKYNECQVAISNAK